MFEQTDGKRGWLSRRMAVWLSVMWAFALGLFTGGLAAGKKPHDWTLFALIVALGVSQTIWAAISATRKTT